MGRREGEGRTENRGKEEEEEEEEEEVRVRNLLRRTRQIHRERIFLAIMATMSSGRSFKLRQTVPGKSPTPHSRASTIRTNAKKPAAKKAGGGGRGAWLGSGEQKFNLAKWYGSERSLFLPTGLLDPDDIPEYLTGELAGDYGYDPLGLGKDGNVAKYREAELIHARWAMLGALGAIVPEAIQSFGATEGNGEYAVWWKTGAALLDGGPGLQYAGLNIPLPLVVVAAVEVALLAGIEKYRADGEGPAGVAEDKLYPGGKYFDPLGLASDPDAFAELQVKEIKNGRLAMVSMLGFAVQAAVTQEGPFANWSKHLADPFGYNIVTLLGADEAKVSL